MAKAPKAATNSRSCSRASGSCRGRCASIYSRPRTFIAVAVGVVAFLCLYLTRLELVTRALIGWDAFAALYLVLVYTMMLQSEHHSIRKHAVLQDDGRFLILLLTGLGAFASIAAICLNSARATGSPRWGLRC